MFTAEQFYQAGGTDAIRAMVTIDQDSFGVGWNDDNVKYSKALVQSFELRDQAKAAFLNGQAGVGEDLLGRSLKSSADFEQRIVLQQYYDKSYTANDLFGNPVTKTLDQAIQDAFKFTSAGVASPGQRIGWGSDPIYRLGEAAQDGGNWFRQRFTESTSTVAINGKSLSFTGTAVGDVNQRMPFVYSLAGNLMDTYRSGSKGDWMSGSQRIYQDQFSVLQKTYGADAVFDVRRRLGF